MADFFNDFIMVVAICIAFWFAVFRKWRIVISLGLFAVAVYAAKLNRDYGPLLLLAYVVFVVIYWFATSEQMRDWWTNRASQHDRAKKELRIRAEMKMEEERKQIEKEAIIRQRDQEREADARIFRQKKVQKALSDLWLYPDRIEGDISDRPVLNAMENKIREMVNDTDVRVGLTEQETAIANLRSFIQEIEKKGIKNAGMLAQLRSLLPQQS